MKELDQLIAFVAQTHFADLPAEVVARTKITVMDSVGAILAGSQLPEVSALGQLAAQSSGSNDVSLIGHAARADAAWACLYHGTAGTSLELDEGHAFSRGHPGMHTLPVVLALSEQFGFSGRQLLTAFVLGYEVAARIGRGTNLRPGTHPHGTWGTPGAAAAAAKLMSYKEPANYGLAEIGESIRVGSNLPLAASFQTAYDGALVRNTFAGVSAQMGLLATQLVRCGFTGEAHGPATVFGKVLSDTYNPKTLIDNLGELYEISRGYFKLHACCRYNHAALDALLNLQARHALEVEMVDRVEVESYLQAAQLAEPQPASTLGALFSIPFAVATTLVNGSTGPQSFAGPMLENEAIRNLAGRVSVREEPSFTAMLPDRRPARVTVYLKNGRSLSKTVYHSKGDPAEPISDTELISKFLDLAEPAIGITRANRVLEIIQKLETVENAQNLIKALAV